MSHKTRSEESSSVFPESIEAFPGLPDPREGRHKRVEEFFGSSGQVKAAKQRGKTILVSDCKNLGHGRHEGRVVMVTDALEGIDQLERENCSGLRSIVTGRSLAPGKAAWRSVTTSLATSPMRSCSGS